LPKFERQLYGNIFNFIPDWFRIDRFNTGETKYLILTIVLNFLLNGIFGPLVEELYFRGFLLPRMKMFGKFAPLINTVLFSIYHFFTPWENITRILAVIPLSYSVWVNKNVNIGIIIHCSLNTFSCFGLLLAIM
jgi:membrane protease YdiL (CAAX protease family)